MIQCATQKDDTARGLYAMIAVECPPDMADDRRIEVISYLNDRRMFLNETPFDQEALLLEVVNTMSRRVEPVIWMRAEAGVSYGEVMTLLSGLANGTPNLHVALVTDQQGRRTR